MDWKKQSWIIYPLAGFLLITLFSLTQAFQFLEFQLYDILLRVHPSPTEDERILLVEIDDPTIAEVGTYPLGREVVADGTVHFWENDSTYVVYDSEYIDLSPRGVNEPVLREDIPRAVSNSLGEVESFGTGLADALASGQLPPSALPEYLDQYREYTMAMEEEILSSIDQVILDKDEYLGQRVGLYGRGVITIGMQDVKDEYVTDELRESVTHFALPNVSGDFSNVAQAGDIRPSIYPISSRAMGLGFPRVYIDDDGVRRQIDLIYQWKEQFYPQLGFAVIMDLYKPKAYEFRRNSLILKDFEHPSKGHVEELRIPLSRDGRMFINWPHEKFLDSFRHLSFLKLLVHDIYVKNLKQNLLQLESWGVMAMYSGENPLDYLNYAEMYLQDGLNGNASLSGEEYRQVRDAAFQAISELTSSSLEQDALAEIGYLIDHPDFPEEQKESLRDLSMALPDLIDALEEINGEIIRLRSEIYEDLNGSIIILGYTGESTQDIGVTPFENHYMNMGLHGAVINTVLQEDFIDDSHRVFPFITALLISALLVIILKKGRSWRSMLIAVILWILSLLFLILMFRVSGIYPGMLMPLLSSIITSIVLLVEKFISENKEKGFIKNAFGQYLSSDVIESILDDPSQLSLGGEEKELTAIFTDVKGFSTISEQLTPTKLVLLLNRYLTTLSDIILDNKGTIDKFEGDAIIAFFGAPHPLKNHASAAVISALQMKKAEAILNEEFLNSDSPLSPSPLLTRVGVNTGRMVVGNMGTVRKMDYTIMGNAVNLAARLEGVNKQYNTWTLCSHFTYEKVKKDVVARPLDSVRVVGINEPVQLYNIMEEKAFASKALMDQLEMFNQAMNTFKSRKWKDAERALERYSDIFQEDKTADIYLERCRLYQEKPPADSWDGVYNLTQK